MLKKTITLLLILLILAGILASTFGGMQATRPDSPYIELGLLSDPAETLSVIITAGDSAAAARAVESLGGEVSSELWLIDAVAATIPAAKLHELAQVPGMRSIVNNKGVRTADWDGWVTTRRVKKATHALDDKFAGASVSLSDGGLFVITENGKILIVNPDGTERARANQSSGKPFNTPPVVGADDTVYLVGQEKRVYAFNADASLKWSFAEAGNKFIGGVAMGPDGTVYAADEGRSLYALDGETGAKLWKFKAPSGDRIKTAPTVAGDGTILAVTEKGYFYALNPDATLKWQFLAGSGDPFLMSALLGPNGILFIAGEEKQVYALDAGTGSLVYQFSTDSKIRAQPAVASDGSLFVAAEDRSLYALNPDGSLRFEFRPPSGKFLTSPTLSPDESLVYVAIKEKKLYAVDAVTGQEAWKHASNGDLDAGPVVDENGDVHLANDQGRYTVFSQQGVIKSNNSGPDPVQFSPIVAAGGNIFLPTGEAQIQGWGKMPDAWDGRPDVIPTEDKKAFQLVNPVAIDLGADVLHDTILPDGQPVTGQGITLAFLDTGIYFTDEVKQQLGQQVVKLFRGQVDFVENGTCTQTENKKYKNSVQQHDGYCWTDELLSYDGYGHGSHMAGIVWNNFIDAHTGVYMGIAPEANILSVRVLGDDGSGTYEDVIEGLQYIVANKDSLNIRVLNLSLSAPQTTPYFVDPLNRAVQEAWAAGIVVLAAAGNTGSAAETITVPGNDPYVITVGALNNNRTPGYWTDDFLSSWSATGPTLDGFIKPDVLAPGSQVVSFMYNDANNSANSSYLVQIHPDFSDTASLYRLNGTSTSSAIASGVVALMLQADPSLTPDEVKFRLMYSARQMLSGDAELGMNFLQQGAGRIWAPDAVLGDLPAGKANAGMDIHADLAHGWGYFDANGDPVLDEAELAHHYIGPVRKVASDDGQSFLYYVDNGDGTAFAIGATDADDNWLLAEQIAENTTWANGNMVWSGGNMVWSGGNMVWSGGNMVWSGGNMVWSGGNMVWSGGNMVWSGGNMVWSGGNMVWSGGTMVWSGSNMVWSGSNMVWSGGNMVWSGTTDWVYGTDTTTSNISTVNWVDR